MNFQQRYFQAQTRRHFLQQGALSLGSVALGSLLMDAHAQGTEGPKSKADNPLSPKKPMLPEKAKIIIYLHMSGAPPQHDLFDYKPKLKELHLKPCPESLLQGQRFAFIKGKPVLLGSPYEFKQYGPGGAWFSSLLPNLAKHADKLAFLKGMSTDQFNHAPAELLVFTGSPRNGAAAMGSWITYGLGTENQNLPAFVVLISGGTDPTGGKALWSTSFLPSVYQGVQCRTSGEPILYVNDPPGMDRATRRRSLDALKALNEFEHNQFGDPETLTRINQYELAFRMQMAVPEAMDIGKEAEKVREQYGAQPGAKSFANNCLLARRLVERGVRYVQLFDWGWDCHGTNKGDDIVEHLPKKCKEIDKPIAALLADLEQRGLLDSTLIIWGGEFGRTSMNEARGGSTFLGRDHHPHCFTIWLSGAGIKGGIVHGATDELGYFVTEGKTSVHDLQATILQLMGLDAFKLRYPYQGLEQRLIGPEGEARVVAEVLA
jgi:hypothetical protein